MSKSITNRDYYFEVCKRHIFHFLRTFFGISILHPLLEPLT